MLNQHRELDGLTVLSLPNPKGIRDRNEGSATVLPAIGDGTGKSSEKMDNSYSSVALPRAAIGCIQEFSASKRFVSTVVSPRQRSLQV